MRKILLCLALVLCLLPWAGAQAEERAQAAEPFYLKDLATMMAVPGQLGTIYLGMAYSDAVANWSDVAGWRQKGEKLHHASKYRVNDSVTYSRTLPEKSPLLVEDFGIVAQNGLVDVANYRFNTLYRQTAVMLRDRAMAVFKARYGEPTRVYHRPEYYIPQTKAHQSESSYEWRYAGGRCGINTMRTEEHNKREKQRLFGRTDLPDEYYIVVVYVAA